LRGLTSLSFRACGPRNFMKFTQSKILMAPERRGRFHIGELEAVSLSDPERACLSEQLGVVVFPWGSGDSPRPWLR